MSHKLKAGTAPHAATYALWCESIDLPDQPLMVWYGISGIEFGVLLTRIFSRDVPHHPLGGYVYVLRKAPVHVSVLRGAIG